MTKNVGDVFSVEFAVQNVTNMAQLGGWVEYDPALVEVVDGDPGTDLTQAVVTNLGFIPSAMVLASVKRVNGVEIPGTLLVSYGAIPVVAQSGSGKCFNVQFRAKAPGTTEIKFAVDASTRVLKDVNGNDIPSEWLGDSLEVLGIVPPGTATVKITIV